MSNSIDQLREGVSSLTEAFTEVESDLDAGVYGAMQPALQKIQENLAAAAVNLDNFAQVQRIMTAMSKSDGAIPSQFVNMIIDHLPPREEIRPEPVRRARPAAPRRGEVREAPMEVNPATRIQWPTDPFPAAFAAATTMPTPGAEAIGERLRGLRAMTNAAIMVDDFEQDEEGF